MGDADAAAWYLGYYGHYPTRLYYGLAGHHGLYYGHHLLGKRSAESAPAPNAAPAPDAAPESDADAAAWYYGHYGYGHGYYGYGYPYYGYYGHHWGKRSADAEPEYDHQMVKRSAESAPAPDAGAAPDADAAAWYLGYYGHYP